MRLFLPILALLGAAPAVTITNSSGQGHFQIQTHEPVKLQTIATIEGLRSGKWTPISVDLGEGYKLLDHCEAKPPPCVAVNGTLTPPPWTGMSCSSQCNDECDKNAPVSAGEYRLVVKTCDGASTITGPSFHFDGQARD
jgi:hypothetical protein